MLYRNGWSLIRAAVLIQYRLLTDGHTGAETGPQPIPLYRSRHAGKSVTRKVPIDEWIVFRGKTSPRRAIHRQMTYDSSVMAPNDKSKPGSVNEMEHRSFRAPPRSLPRTFLLMTVEPRHSFRLQPADTDAAGHGPRSLYAASGPASFKLSQRRYSSSSSSSRTVGASCEIPPLHAILCMV